MTFFERWCMDEIFIPRKTLTGYSTHYELEKDTEHYWVEKKFEEKEYDVVICGSFETSFSGHLELGSKRALYLIDKTKPTLEEKLETIDGKPVYEEKSRKYDYLTKTSTAIELEPIGDLEITLLKTHKKDDKLFVEYTIDEEKKLKEYKI